MAKKSLKDGGVAALKKTGGFITEFKEFISKGNVMDLAVGMIIGAAFTAIVNSLVNDIIMPFMGMIMAGINFTTLGVTIPWGNKPFIAFGNFIQNIITFLLTALCIFIMIKVINAFKRKKEEEPVAPAAKPDDVVLLEEIRDLLKAQSGIDDETKEAVASAVTEE